MRSVFASTAPPHADAVALVALSGYTGAPGNTLPFATVAQCSDLRWSFGQTAASTGVGPVSVSICLFGALRAIMDFSGPLTLRRRRHPPILGAGYLDTAKANEILKNLIIFLGPLLARSRDGMVCHGMYSSANLN